MKVSWPLNWPTLTLLWPFKVKVEKCNLKYFCLLESPQYLAQIIGKTSPWSVPKRMAGTFELFEMPVSMSRQIAKMLKCPETICVSTVITLVSMARLTWNLVSSFCIACWILYMYFQIQITLHGLTWPALTWPDLTWSGLAWPLGRFILHRAQIFPGFLG